jgi:hypothetical protein
MRQVQTAIDLDGNERTIAQLCERHGLTRWAIVRRLVKSDEGPPRFRQAVKPGRKRKEQVKG